MASVYGIYFYTIAQVYYLTRKYLTSSHYIKNRFLLCPVWRGLPILRDPNSKWYASYEQVPKVGEEGKESYPTDCTGWLWITSPGTSQAISEAAQVVRFFWIDDVWVSGFIAEHLKIQHQVRRLTRHVFIRLGSSSFSVVGGV